MESVVFKFNDSKRYRRIVGSIAGSCLVAVTPLIASADAAACSIALDIVEVSTFISTITKLCPTLTSCNVFLKIRSN